MLKLSTDRKTTPISSPNGKTPKIANAFGLPSGRDYSCPGQTSVCERVCYAGKLEKLFPGFRNVMLENWETLMNARNYQIVDLLDELLIGFESECERLDSPKYFRIHHDGDFYSDVYAAAWAEVVLRHPDVQFWVYTRSFGDSLNVVPLFDGIDNIAFYLSVDDDNIDNARKVKMEYPWVRIAYLAQTADVARNVMFDITGKPGAACPEVIKRIPLITNKGGACISCRLCPEGKSDIRFSISKKER